MAQIRQSVPPQFIVEFGFHVHALVEHLPSTCLEPLFHESHRIVRCSSVGGLESANQ